MAKKKSARRSGTKKNPNTSTKKQVKVIEAPVMENVKTPTVAVAKIGEKKKKNEPAKAIEEPVVENEDALLLEIDDLIDTTLSAPPQNLSETKTTCNSKGHVLQHIWDRITGYLFVSDDENHWRHHANPWSVWTSLSCLPLLVLAIYSRLWWGAYSWIAVGLAILWLWLNPRIFPVPKTTRCWASYAVFGERIWFHRYDKKSSNDAVPAIPHHHFIAIYALSALMLANGIYLAIVLIDLKFAQTMLSTMIQVMAHLWFYDRMVWLYTDMYYEDAEYESWVY